MKRFKTYAFWIALSGAVVILIQSLGKLFGFQIESSLIENVIMSICGVLVVLGIVTKAPEDNNQTNESNTENSDNDVEETNVEEDKTNDKENK